MLRPRSSPKCSNSRIDANPVSFTIDGHQCIAIADRVLYVFGP